MHTGQYSFCISHFVSAYSFVSGWIFRAFGRTRNNEIFRQKATYDCPNNCLLALVLMSTCQSDRAELWKTQPLVLWQNLILSWFPAGCGQFPAVCAWLDRSNWGLDDWFWQDHRLTTRPHPGPPHPLGPGQPRGWLPVGSGQPHRCAFRHDASHLSATVSFFPPQSEGNYCRCTVWFSEMVLFKNWNGTG